MYRGPRTRQRERPQSGVRRRRFLATLGAVGLGLLATLASPVADASVRKPHRVTLEPPTEELVAVPLTVHVATREGLPVVSRHHVLESVARANRELREFGVQLRVRTVELMPDGYDDVVRIRHRLRLAERSPRNGTVHVYFVDRVELSNPQHGDRRVSGMHWRYRGMRRGLRSREFLAVAHNAPITTFVHEIGHLFGLGHRHQTDNVMCSCERAPTPSFSSVQGRQLRVGARRFLARAAVR